MVNKIAYLLTSRGSITLNYEQFIISIRCAHIYMTAIMIEYQLHLNSASNLRFYN